MGLPDQFFKNILEFLNPTETHGFQWGPFLVERFFRILFWMFLMVELRCSLDVALAIGAEVPGTRNYLEQLPDDGNMVVIHYADFAPPLIWKWALGRDEGPEARKNARRGE